MRGIPKLTIAKEIEESKNFDPNKVYKFRYRRKRDKDLPHVVKFSGGRSSGMLLFTLLENGFLRSERGDVVVFNNTSCEHPETYKFAAECKRRVEKAGVPFFFVQYQTYEDARQGDWTRMSSYRLVNECPASDDNPEGFQWQGEVFEEMLSHKAYVPNQFTRVCTQSLKLESTRQFLRDWFASKPSIPELGHGLENSQISTSQLHKRHVRNGGGIPEDILLEKKRFVLNRPTTRPAQTYKDFSRSADLFENPAISDKVFGRKAWFGKDGMEYVAFIGLRGDEHLRVARVESRSSSPHANAGYEGEQVYMPLASMNIGKDDVNAFWDSQDWDLRLPRNGALSNCAYCFLKGVGALQQVHAEMETQKASPIAGFGPITETPCDINWWIQKEKQYGRDLDAENRQRSNVEANSLIGFFGASSDFSYEKLHSAAKDGASLERYADSVLPCDCTE